MYSLRRATVSHCRANRVESKWKDFGNMEQRDSLRPETKRPIHGKSETVALVVHDDSRTGDHLKM